MSDNRIPVVGFVGGIGSGKSSLARWLNDQPEGNVHIIDADAIGHQALTIPEIQQQLIASFGESILTDQNVIDRSVLAKRVFGDDSEARDCRQRLEAIVHPYITQQIKQEIADAQTQNETDLILIDAAVMLEAGWSSLCDLIIFLDVPESERVRRVQQTRHWTKDDFHKRESSQWPLSRKRAAAGAILDMNQPLEQAGGELRKILNQYFSDMRHATVPTQKSGVEIRTATGGP